MAFLGTLLKDIEKNINMVNLEDSLNPLSEYGITKDILSTEKSEIFNEPTQK